MFTSQDKNHIGFFPTFNIQHQKDCPKFEFMTQGLACDFFEKMTYESLYRENNNKDDKSTCCEDNDVSPSMEKYNFTSLHNSDNESEGKCKSVISEPQIHDFYSFCEDEAFNSLPSRDRRTRSDPTSNREKSKKTFKLNQAVEDLFQKNGENQFQKCLMGLIIDLSD
jgi:hypothetical protein